MKVIKNINNNVSLCLDSHGNEVIAFGKGIGFLKPPCEIPLAKIERTFYDVNSNYYSIIAQIPDEIFKLASKIVDYANLKTDNRYTSSLIVTLADHIQFTLKRAKNNINIKLPLLYEVKQLYPEEMQIGIQSLKIINETLKIKLPQDEAASIALHLVYYNSQMKNTAQDSKSAVEQCADVIEQEMDISIDKTGFHYLRFVTHMYYLLDRVNQNTNISSENEKMFLALKEEYPKTYQCALKVKKALNVEFNDEELLYLILHINRLCIREDCYLE